MRLILAIMMLCASAAQGGDMPDEVRFADLADPAARQFDDPYLAMGPERLEDLKTVVRLDERLAEDDLATDTRQRLDALRVAAQDRLSADGHDIEALLSQRWTVAQQRARARIATNPALKGAEVTLSGYLIPAGKEEDGRALGYIVPVVGMCSHISPPPPNELVRVRFDPALAGNSIYLPVRVSGTLSMEASDESIQLLDGYVRMQSLWRLDAQTVVLKGSAAPPETAASANHHHDTVRLTGSRPLSKLEFQK